MPALKTRLVASFCIPHSAFRIPHWKLVLTLAIALTFPAVLTAQPASPPSLGKVRIGLPTGSTDAGRMRQGAWAPIYISLTGGANGNGQQQFKVVLEALDGEENPYRYSVPVPAISAGANDVVMGYLRAPNQEFTVSIQTLDGKTLQGPSKHTRSAESEPIKPIVPLFVVMGGSKLPKLKKALAPPAQVKDGEVADATYDEMALRGYACITKVEEMPDRWFGYDAADVVILTTANDTFIKDLTAPAADGRRKALAEWVRRGGKLVLSVGRNTQMVEGLLRSMPLKEVDQMRLVPYEINGSVYRPSLRSVSVWANFHGFMTLGEGYKDGVQVAVLTPAADRPEKAGLGDGTTVLKEEEADAKDSKKRPIIVQSSCGLGRVLLIAFDIDAPPFTDWKGQEDFWVKLRDETAGIRTEDLRKALSNFAGSDSPELMTGLQQYIDTFEDVPVVSFGWVALFIFVYILVVGPLDYFILKKVFKRLELTWITFPAVVVTISVGAYFIAYALKGDDLRVNKVDLVEIDLHTPQAYGTSWFSVFSPRMQNYTLSVDPVFKSGSPGNLVAPRASTTMALLENPAAAARGGSTSLFRQPYEYSEDASGIERVPIPVWSTRTFMASWRTPYPSDKPPFRANLVRQGDIITGQIINEMPVDLEDVCLIYHDRWYALPNNRTLAAKIDGRPADQFEVAELAMSDNGIKGQGMDRWYSDPVLSVNRTLPQTASRRMQYKGPAAMGPAPGWNEQKKEILFYRDQAQIIALNSSLRSVNQRWRLNSPYRDEVILVARTPYASGKAKKVNDEGLVQLWTDRLPGTADQCPDLTGYLNQETYIRIYIPVKK